MIKDCGQLDGEKHDPKKIIVWKKNKIVSLGGLIERVVTDFPLAGSVFINQS